MGPTTASRRPRSLALGRNIQGWLFISPWLIGFLLFTFGPMVASAAFSFTDWDLVSPPRWAGLGNFARMVGEDPLVLQALKVTTVYAVTAVPLHVVFGLAVALLLNTGVRGMRFYRTGYYLPAVISGVAVALLWRWLFSPEFGLINIFLSLIGISGPAWLADETWALPSLVVMSLWGVGAGMIIYLAGLQGIPSELYEAAAVDGATWWPRLTRVTVPLMTPVLFYQLVVGIIGALQTFTQAFIMTSGGPHDATLFYVLYLYRNAFQYLKMGYAAALAWVLFLYILLLTLLVFRSSSAWVYYEGQLRGR